MIQEGEHYSPPNLVLGGEILELASLDPMLRNVVVLDDSREQYDMDG